VQRTLELVLVNHMSYEPKIEDLKSMAKECSVIISTYSEDRLAYVINCIKSLEQQSLPPKEIILVLDPDQELFQVYIAKAPKHVKIVTSDNKGLSNARNTGVRKAEEDILAFIDDDAVADKHWLNRLTENYDDPSVVGVGGVIKPLWEGNRPAWFPEELYWTIGCSYKGLPERKASVRNPIGCNMSFRKSAFARAGYFRSDIGRFGKKLLAGEETELSMRMLTKIPNSRIIYDPSAIVYHLVDKKRTNLTYLFKRSFYEGVSKALIRNSRSNSSVPLLSENQYLKYLLENSAPRKLRRIYNPKNLCQLLVLLLSVSAVSAGYVTNRYNKGG